MRIQRAAFAPYALALAQPLTVGSASLAERKGFILALADAEGHVGYGEAAPLPGLHSETLEQVQTALAAFCAKVPGARFGELEALSTAGSEWEGDPMPSFVFALEMAWLGLEARRLGKLPAQLLGPAVQPRVYVNALLACAGDPLPPLAPRAVLKVKVGRQPPEQDAAQLAQLLQRLSPDVRLRLDANRAYELDDAIRLLSGVARERVEYIEEPLKNPELTAKLFAATGHEIALDETLLETEHHALLTAPGVRAWVLKPSRLGGALATVQWMEAARGARRYSVVSSAFESSLALEFLAQLASVAGELPVAHGLGTAAWLLKDTQDPPLLPECGEFAPALWRGRPSDAWLAGSELGTGLSP